MRRENFHGFIIKIFIPLFSLGMLVGILNGFITGLYNFLGELLSEYSKKLFDLCRRDIKYIPIPLAAVIVLALIIGFLGYKFPEIRGSGIPYIECVARGKLNLQWYISLPFMFFVSLISLISGMSLGSEGPSVYMGGCIGYGIGKLFKIAEVHEFLLVAAGSSTGLAIAFNAPLSGLIFSLEEVYRKFSAVIIMTAALAVCVGLSINELIFGQKKLDIGTVHYEFEFILLLLSFFCGIIGGLCGVLFNLMIRLSPLAYQKIKFLPRWVYPVIPCIVGVFLAVYLPNACFGGASTIKILFWGELTTWRIVACFFVKFLFTVLCFGSSASGGIFIPMLTVGALLGGALSKLFILIGMAAKYEKYVILVTLSSFFTGIVRAPLTATILFVEYTGQFSGFFGPLTAVAVAYLAAEFTRVPPLYEALMEKIVNPVSDNLTRSPSMELGEIAFTVGEDSMVRGMELNEVTLPDGTAVARIIRDEQPMVPRDDLVLESDDEVWFVAENRNTASVEMQLRTLF